MASGSRRSPGGIPIAGQPHASTAGASSWTRPAPPPPPACLPAHVDAARPPLIGASVSSADAPAAPRFHDPRLLGRLNPSSIRVSSCGELWTTSATLARRVQRGLTIVSRDRHGRLPGHSAGAWRSIDGQPRDPVIESFRTSRIGRRKTASRAPRNPVPPALLSRVRGIPAATTLCC